MSRVPKAMMEQFQEVEEAVTALIDTAESILVDSIMEAPPYTEFQRNNEMTYKWIFAFQEKLTEVASVQTRIGIEDRRMCGFLEALKTECGILESEALSKRVRFHIKTLRDLRDLLKERKSDLSQNITSLRSVQSAITGRFRATQGN